LVVDPKEDSETVQILGTPLMMRKNFSKELATNLDKVTAENLSSRDQLSSCYQVSTEAEELLF
jgi:hypothetical protein